MRDIEAKGVHGVVQQVVLVGPVPVNARFVVNRATWLFTLSNGNKKKNSQEVPYGLYCLLQVIVLGRIHFMVQRYQSGLLFYGTGTLSASHPTHNVLRIPFDSGSIRPVLKHSKTPGELSTHIPHGKITQYLQIHALGQLGRTS